MIIVVQHIKSSWTKWSRSAPQATVRNRVPTTTSLPVVSTIPHRLSLVYHKADWWESSEFSRQPHRENVTVREMQQRRHELFECVSVRWQDEQLHVIYRYNRMFGGAPERTERPRRVLTLVPGQWGRVEYNGRHVNTCTGSWYYTKSTFNCTITDSITPTLFNTEPHRTFSDMAHLF